MKKEDRLKEKTFTKGVEDGYIDDSRNYNPLRDEE